MTEILKLYKNLGETPLECILRYKAEHPEHKETKMTYLGRLDPMAEGLLLVLAGNTKDKKKYLEWDKTYEFEVFWGFETDTYDILGLASTEESVVCSRTGVGEFATNGFLGAIDSLLKKIKAKRTQSYPPFSSRVFRGNFLSVRDGKIDEVDLPTRSVKIFNIEHIHTRLENYHDISLQIGERIDLVKGDFRQAEIKRMWQKALDKKGDALISKFKADVSSGTYIRSLAHEMGEILGTRALAFSIKRTRVGEYKLD